MPGIQYTKKTRLIIYWRNKLYLHPFDRVEGVEGCRPETGQSDVIQFIDPVDNRPSVYLYSTTFQTIDKNI